MKIIKSSELLYLVGLFLLCLLNWEYFSLTINFIGFVRNMLFVLTVILFIVSIILKKYKFKELMIILIVSFVLLIVSFYSRNYYIFVNGTAMVSSKDIPYKKIVKFIFFFNCTMILFHLFTYLLGVNSNNKIYYTFLDNKVRLSLNMRHPNTLAAILFWTYAAFVYIENNKSWFLKTLIGLLITTLMYFTTYSRTTIILFIILLFLNVVKSEKLMIFIEKWSKIVIAFLLFLSIFVAINYNTSGNFGNILEKVNYLLSYRLYFNNLAIKLYGYTFIGKSISAITKDVLIIDSFYISCLVEYGILLLMLCFTGFIKYNVKNNYYNFKFLLIVFITAFTERYIVFITLAFPMLFLGDAIFSNEKGKLYGK